MFYRGSLENVHSRFYNIIKNLNKPHNVIRLTSDNPFVSSKILNQLIRQFEVSEKKYMYIDNKISNLPYGISAEIFCSNFFLKVPALTSLEKEHVTLKFKKKKFIHLIKTFNYKKNFNNLSRIRLTVDYIKDYKFILNIAKKFKKVSLNTDKLIQYSKKKYETNELKSEFNNKFVLGTAQLCNNYGINSQRLSQKKLDNRSSDILDRAKDFDIKYIDTAFSYLNTEIKIGNFQKKNKINFKIYTKLGSLPRNIKKQNASKKIDSYFFISLKRLAVKKIHCMYVHKFSDLFIFDYLVLKRLIFFKQKKIIKNIGISVYCPKEFEIALKIKEIDTIQIPFNLIDYRWNNIFNNYKHQIAKKEIIARSVFLQGALLEKKKSNIKNFISKALKNTNSISEKDLLIRYVKSHNWISKIIIGIEDPNHINELYALFNRPNLTRKNLDYIKKNNKITSHKILQPNLW
tara:strand:- start:1056 stop:2435 length:1380 start_codon:yes stop_codon:yes gene_type:complete